MKFKDLGLHQNYWQLALLCCGCLLLSGCDNVTLTDAQTMLINFSQNYAALWQLTTGTAYIFGIAFILRGIFKLKIYGEQRTMMSSHGDLKGSLMLLIVGTVLVYLPTAFHSALISTFGDETVTPLSYSTQNKAWSQAATDAVLGLIQLVGVVSFVRGWIYLTHSGQGSQHTVGKALTHIIGGVFAVNIQGTINVLQASLGIG